MTTAKPAAKPPPKKPAPKPAPKPVPKPPDPATAALEAILAQQKADAQAAKDAAAAAAAQAAVDKQNAQRDATTILTNLFHQYDLDTLTPTIIGYIQQGYNPDAVSVLLSQTPEYKQRFAANDQRIKKGLAALSPAEYIATERSYRQIMSSAGLPTGFYDTQNDFTNFIANDISPTELQNRVQTATDAINKAPANTLDYFGRWYSTSDLVAYALDPTRAEPLVEKRIKAAEAGALGANAGVNLDATTAEAIAGQGYSMEQMRKGLGFIGVEGQTTNKLDQIYGGNVTQGDLVAETFFDDALASQKRAKLAETERSNFQGSSAANTASLRSETVV